jgi:ABC-type phosphate/phosphonate transport system substrate-binding protein
VRGLLLFGLLASAQTAPLPQAIVHVGFSARSLVDANRTDVTAAMKAWLLTAAKERNLTIRFEPVIFESLPEMENALRREQVDTISATTDDYLVLEKAVPLTKVFVTKIAGRITEQYVLLVHREQPVKELRDLRGATLFVMDHPRTSLAPHWLDVELLHHKLPIATRFFGTITHVSKPTLAILPVFFKQAGGALVTRASFDTAVELNPQLARTLRVLAVSPEVIPMVGAFRANAVSGAVDFYRREALRLHESQGGKLVLNLFQSDGLVEIEESDLAGTRTLLAEYARLKAEAERRGTAP